MYNQRLTDRLTNYWNNLRRDGAMMPDFGHFNSAAIEDIWQQCILFTVLPTVAGTRPSLQFYRVGEKLRDIYSNDVLGQPLTPNQRHFQAAAVVRKIDEIIANPAPLIDMGQFISDNSKIIKYRSCLLPFGKGGVVTHVIAGLSWKEF